MDNEELRRLIFDAPLASETGFRQVTSENAPSLPPSLPPPFPEPVAKRAKTERIRFDPHSGLFSVYGGVKKFLTLTAAEIREIDEREG